MNIPKSKPIPISKDGNNDLKIYPEKTEMKKPRKMKESLNLNKLKEDEKDGKNNLLIIDSYNDMKIGEEYICQDGKLYLRNSQDIILVRSSVSQETIYLNESNMNKSKGMSFKKLNNHSKKKFHSKKKKKNLITKKKKKKNILKKIHQN